MDWHALQHWFNEFKWAFAGFFGAVVASSFHRDEINSRRDFVMFVFTGFMCAHFLTGLVANHFGISPEHTGAIGFLLGAFGGSLISAVIKALRAADLWALVKQRLGGGN